MTSLFLDPVSGTISAVGDALDKLFTSDDEKLSLELAKQRLFLKADEIQAVVNQQEAAHRSVFIAGWRPFIGWVCGIGIFYVYIVYPFLLWLAAIYAPELTPPTLESDSLLELVMAMLGLSGLRTYEKLKNKTK